MKPEFLEYINTALLSFLSFFVFRFINRIDKTEKKVEQLDNRVLIIETRENTKKEMKVGYATD
jgi:hypothetical protein